MSEVNLVSAYQDRTVKELRSVLASRQVDYSDCLEKSELVARVLSTMEKEPLVQNNILFGTLDCTVIQNSRDQHDFIIVLIHGYGANSSDLSNIAKQVILPQVKSKIKVVFPNAPLKLSGNSFAWWNIDLPKYVALATTGQEGIEKIANDIPEGFSTASELILSLLKDLSVLYSVPVERIIIGGFSQGAMLAIEVGLKSNVAGIIAWSVGMVNGVEWRNLAKEKKFKVFQSHGTADPLIPFLLGSKVKEEVFEANQQQLVFIPFKGGHQISPEVLVKTLHFLKEIFGE